MSPGFAVGIFGFMFVQSGEHRGGGQQNARHPSASAIRPEFQSHSWQATNAPYNRQQATVSELKRYLLNIPNFGFLCVGQ
jgi:hypothetical protein